MFAYYFFKHRRMCLRYGMYIGLNAVGKGFFIVHPGFIRIDSWVTYRRELYSSSNGSFWPCSSN